MYETLFYFFDPAPAAEASQSVTVSQRIEAIQEPDRQEEPPTIVVL